MTEITKYKLTFIEAPIRVSDDKLTFLIENIKSREISVLYFKFYGYDVHSILIEEYTSSRWVITPEYSKKSETWDLTASPKELDHYVIEMYLLGVNSENPLYMNHLQLNEGEELEYHKPNDTRKNVSVGFFNNQTINLYDLSENFLQIIRPYKEGLTTEELSKSQMTILAPHLENETEFDDPAALFYEYMYMVEQIIGVEK